MDICLYCKNKNDNKSNIPNNVKNICCSKCIVKFQFDKKPYAGNYDCDVILSMLSLHLIDKKI